MKRTDNHQDLLGLILAAGNASRLQPLPCSKEIFPTGFYVEQGGRDPRPRAVCSYLLEAMHKADIVLGLFHAGNPQKMDIADFEISGKVRKN